jgi:cell division protein FtsB
MNPTITIPLTYFVGAFVCLTGTIGVLGRTIFAVMQTRLNAQDKLLDAQDKRNEQTQAEIVHLRLEVSRLSKGCGLVTCHWSTRKPE